MDAFVWDQHFVTGLADVDEQHHGLVDLFNELSQTLFTSQGSAAPVDADALLQGVFQRLVRYAQFHFADEENLMHRLGMDPRHIQVHQERHQEFVQQLHALWSTRASMAAPAESFASFLTGWLGLHILGIDQSMSRQLAAMEQGASAQQAYERELAAHDNGSTQVLLKMIGKLYQVLSAQNNALAEANQSLEARVARRTRALAQANSELQQANVRLEAFGRTDGLLQIANRGYFDDRLAHAGASAHRHRQPLGLLMIDVDEFKRYNDHFGHQAGDACLQAVARAVQGSAARHRPAGALRRRRAGRHPARRGRRRRCQRGGAGPAAPRLGRCCVRDGQHGRGSARAKHAAARQPGRPGGRRRCRPVPCQGQRAQPLLPGRCPEVTLRPASAHRPRPRPLAAAFHLLPGSGP